MRKIIFILIIAGFLLRIPLILTRSFDADEFEHLHATRSFCYGMVPYRDYFEHHMPLLYFLLAPMYHFSGDRIETLFIARWIMFIFAFGILCLTYTLARLLYSTEIALYAVLFLSCVVAFVNKTVEIRPQVPGVFFELLTIIFCVQGIQKKISKNSNLFFFASGLAMGASILFDLKLLFCAAGIFLALWGVVLVKDRELPFSRRMGPFIWMWAGFIIFPLLACLYFYLNHALGAFIYRTFTMNLSMKHTFSLYRLTGEIFRQNFLFCITGLAGFVIAGFQLLDKEAPLRGYLCTFFVLSVFVFGLFLIRIPYLQYYVAFIPLVSIYSGLFISLIMSPLNFYREEIKNHWWINLVSLVLLAGIVFSPVRTITAQFLDFQYSPYKSKKLHLTIKHSNALQIKEIQWIEHNTSPQDSVFDGWSGLGVFRNHAYYYYFLHGEIREMMTLKELSVDILTALREKKPKLVIFDHNIVRLSQAVTEFIKGQYEPKGMGDIYILKKSLNLGS